jgi:hypothetical protein
MEFEPICRLKPDFSRKSCGGSHRSFDREKSADGVNGKTAVIFARAIAELDPARRLPASV